MHTKGIKNSPLRAIATRLARIGLRMVCINIFVKPIVGKSINVSICQRRAAVPTATTSGSLRNTSTISCAKMVPNIAQSTKKQVPILMQYKKPSRTRP